MFAELIERFGTATVRVNGLSMLPAIRPGDMVTVRRCSVMNLAPGEVAVFTRDGRLFVHRVLAVGPDQLLTKGDSLRTPDPLVEAHHLLGRAESVSRANRAMQLSSRPSIAAKLAARLFARSSRLAILAQRGFWLQQRLAFR